MNNFVFSIILPLLINGVAFIKVWLVVLQNQFKRLVYDVHRPPVEGGGELYARKFLQIILLLASSLKKQ
jgi:hypothetical protein